MNKRDCGSENASIFAGVASWGNEKGALTKNEKEKKGRGTREGRGIVILGTDQ